MSADPEILPRICGTEMEYQPNLTKPYVLNYGENLLVELYRHLPPGVVMENHFLSNGARVYPDQFQCIEYSTPESLGFAEAVYAEYAGERIVATMFERWLEMKYADYAHRPHIYMPKSSVDENGVTVGYHECYSTTDEGFANYKSSALTVAHLATRGVLTGGGATFFDNEGVSFFSVTQKSEGVTQITSQSTTSENKPIVNTKDEPLAKYSKRIHVTSGDPNISPWASWMQLGCMSLIIRLLEADPKVLEGIPLPMLAMPLETMHRIASDATASQKVCEMQDGKPMRALSVQQWLAKLCRFYAQRVELPQEEMLVLDEWERACEDGLEDRDNLMGRSGWVRRLAWIEAAKDRMEGAETERAAMHQPNAAFHKLTGKNIVDKVRTKMPFPGYDPSKIDQYITSPPQYTRAKLRASMIKELRKNNRRNGFVSWDGVRRTDGRSICNWPSPRI